MPAITATTAPADPTQRASKAADPIFSSVDFLTHNNSTSTRKASTPIGKWTKTG